MKPLISLITPTYNVKDFVQGGINSILDQSLDQKYFEWVLLDDGSSDGTDRVIKDAVRKMDFVSFFSRNKNLGTSKTRNQAISLSRGQYLAFLDMDDLLETNALESMLNIMESEERIKFSYSMHKRIDSDGKFICNRGGIPFSREKLLHFNFVGALKCVDRDIHNQIGGFDESFFRYSEDYDYILRVSEVLEDGQIIQNPKYLYKYRMHGNNNMNNFEKMRENACLAIKNSLKRKEGLDVEVFWDHKKGLYNFYNWRKNETTRDTK